MGSHNKLAVAAVEKQNSTAYLDAIFDCHDAGLTVLPVVKHSAAVPPGIQVIRRHTVDPRGGWYQRAVAPKYCSDPALISLSSGTTGSPKAFLLSHAALADVTDRLGTAMNLDSAIREYLGAPVTFSFGFGRARAIASVGGALYLPVRGFRVDEFAGLLATGEVNALSAVPTLLRLLLNEKQKFIHIGASLRWLEIGSQSISADEKEALRRTFPNARIVQHYGLTEASRSTFLDIGSEEKHLSSVGQPSGNVEVRIVDGGRIAIRGPHLATGIVTADGVMPFTDEEGWLVTSDLGHIADGYLYFDGRADDLINIGGVKVQAEAFERALISRTQPQGEIVVAAMSDALLGQKALIVSTAHADLDMGSALRAVAREVAADFKVAERGFELAFLEEIPKTETNKVKRHALAGLVEPVPHVSSEAGRRATGVHAVFLDAFGAPANDTKLNFVDLGGDSLTYVRTSLELEAILSTLPDGWETLSIAELMHLEDAGEEALPASPAQRGPGLLLNLDTLRGLACLMIVALHVIGAEPTDGLQLPANSGWHQVMSNLEFIRLPLFTCLAGIFYGALPAARLGWAGFMSRKLQQFLPPLIFATLAFWFLRRAIYGTDESLLLAFVDGYLHLWYLDALLIMFAVAAAADLLAGSRRHLLLLAAAVSAALYLMLPHVEVLHLRNTLFLFPFFVFGVLLYRDHEFIAHHGTLLVALPLTAAYPCAYYLLGDALPGTALDALLTWTSGAAATVVLLRLMPRIGPLEIISIYSFTIYLWHPLASAMARTAVAPFGVAPTWLSFSIGLVAGVAVPMAIHRIADKLPVLGRLLKG